MMEEGQRSDLKHLTASMTTATTPAVTIPSTFDGIASKWPNNSAIQFEGSTTLTYAELQRLARRLAGALHHSVKPGQLVPVLLDRSVAQVASILAVQYLRAVYVPIDPSLPEARIEGLLSRISPPVIITIPSVAGRSWQPCPEQQSFNPELFIESTDPEDSTFPLIEVDADDVAAILFTSGSTGQPKGVRLTHRNLLDPIMAFAADESLGPTSRLFQFASCSFDVHMIDIYGTILNGACLCQVSQDKMLGDLAHWIRVMEADTVHLTPSVISMLRPEDVPSLKYMVTCGEPVTQAVVSKWSERVELRNLYGPCEASSINWKLLTPSTALNNVGPISSFAQVVIVDPETHCEASPGEIGEIYAGGSCIAAGYWNDPAKTSSSFFYTTPSPESQNQLNFSRLDGQEFTLKSKTWYASGDFGYLNSDGELCLTGRADSQVKVNGQRVELGEIDQVLSSQGVTAVTRTKKDRTGQTRIFAFVTTSTIFGSADSAVTLDQSAGAKELSRRLAAECRRALPSYMCPRILVVEKLPQNYSQKIDMRKLSLFLDSYLNTNTTEDRNRELDDIQTRLAAFVCSRVQQTVPVDEDVRDWGLSSMDAIALGGEIRTVFKVGVVVREIFDCRTIAALASVVHRKMKSRGQQVVKSEEEVPPQNMDTADSQSFTASAAQCSIYRAHQLVSNGAYNTNFAFRISSSLFITQLFLGAVEKAYQDFDILRTTYSESADGEIQCHVHEAHALPTDKELMSFSHLSAATGSTSTSAVEAYAKRLIEQSARAPIDVGDQTMCKVSVYEISRDSDVFIVHFRIHHLVMDEWSFELFHHHVMACYSGMEELDSRDSLSYSQFSILDREARKASLIQDREWWSSFADEAWAEPSAQALSMRQGIMSKDFSAERESSDVRLSSHCLPRETVEAFIERCSSHHTRFACWLPLCEVFLARVMNKTQFLLGIPTSARTTDSRFKDVMGCCIGTTPLPATVDFALSFREIQSRADELYWEAVGHTQPVEEVMRWLTSSTADDAARLDVLFVYHDKSSLITQMEERIGAGSTVESLDIQPGGAHFPLIVHVDESGTSPRIFFEYQTSVFSEDFVSTLAQAFQAMMGFLAENGPETQASELPMCSPDSIQGLVTQSTTSMSPSLCSDLLHGPDLFLHDLVTRAAAKFPNNIALYDPDGQVNFNSLARQIQALSLSLRASGLSSGKSAMIFLEKSMDYVESLLAILSTGALFVAMDVHEKTAVNQGKVDTLVPDMMIINRHTRASHGNLLLPTSCITFDMDALDHTTLPHSASSTAVSCTTLPPQQAVAYVGFTSGSTAAPKSFRISHSSAVAAILSQAEVCDFTSKDRVPMLTNVVFDISILEIFATLASGGSLIIAPHDAMISDLAGVLNRHKATRLIATPTILSQLAGPRDVPSIRTVILGGEPTPQRVSDLWARDVRIFGSYGPAEASMVSHAHQLTQKVRPGFRGTCIGRPSPTARTYVLDESHQILPHGWLGRLAIGARAEGRVDQLSLGYISPSEANSRFISHPQYGRLFDTGDLCYMDSDGMYHLVGRDDDQIKINGVRFNLNDAEAAVNRQIKDGASHAALIAVDVRDEHQSTQKGLAAFVPVINSAPDTNLSPPGGIVPLSRGRMAVDLHDLRDRVSAVLPAAMVPKYWLPVTSLPRGRTGKIDRKALAGEFRHLMQRGAADEYRTLVSSSEPIPSQPQPAEVPARHLDDSLSARLRECWITVLPKGTLCSPDLSFFKAGGDSITAIRFCSQARLRGIQGCSVHLMNANPTLGALSRVLRDLQPADEGPADERSLVDEAGNGDSGTTVESSEDALDWLRRHHQSFDQDLERRVVDSIRAQCELSIDDVGRVYTAGPMQKAMLAQSEMDPDVYTSQILFNFIGPLDISRLDSAWRSVCRAHPSLHTRFMKLAHSSECYVVELKSSDAATAFQVPDDVPLGDEELEDTLTQLRRTALNSSRITSAVTVFRRTSQENLVVLTCNHAIADGWSMSRLLSDWAQAYRGQTIELGFSMSRVRAADLVRDPSEAKHFWQKHTSKGQTASLSQSNGREGQQVRFLRHDINGLTDERLRRICTDLDITPATLFKAALSISLHKATGLSNPLFWVTTSERDRDISGCEEAVGNFLNAVPCVNTVDANARINIWLYQMHLAARKCSQHSWLPASAILETLPDGDGLINVLLVIENHAQHGRLAFDDKLTVGDIEGREFSDIPVSVIVEPRDDSVLVTVKYNELHVNSDSARTLIQDFVDVTASFVSQTSGATIRNVLASDAQKEKHYLLHELETIGQTKPSQDTLLSLFESSVRQNSEATALQTYGTTLTYLVVDQLSTKLAALILLHTRGRQQFIPILLPRRPQMIISMLAILKAGCAYCPLDLEAPESRLEYLIGTLDSTVILTDDSGYLLLPAKLHQYLRVLNIDNMDWMMDHHEEISLPVVTPASPCYVIFTSGSTTGKPKACVLTHEAVASSMKAIIPIFQLDANSRVLLFANAIFDASVVDIYGALFSGATLFLVSEDILKTDIAKAVNDLRINFLHMTPTMLQMLDIESCPSLKTVVSGGEQIPLWLKNKFAARVRFIGNYGPTETAVQVATGVSDVPSDEESLYSPTPGNVLVILNSHGGIARQGEPGEVYIGGRQLFQGYLKDKAKTCESLVKIPSLGDHMFYRSGDRGKYTEGMQVQLLSRTHGHLKYLGQRLDPHEIESVLNQAPNVAVTAVVLVNAALFAAVESRSELDLDTVRQLAEMSLPKRLVPLLVQVQKVPQLPSGKIDRRAAAKLITDEIQARQNKAGLKDTQRRAPPSGVVEKTRNVEHRIRDIVNGIVQLPIEDIDKSLSLVGLDSLGFVRLRQEIVRQLDVSISYISLRKADSVRGVSQLVEESGQMAINNIPAATNQLSTVPAIQHLPPPPPSPSRYPAIPSQQSMWMAHNQLSNNSYLVQRVQQVMGHSPTQLISAVMELSHRLVIFRTTFEYDWDDEKLYEVTNEKPNIHLSYDMLKDASTMKAQVAAWSETVKADLQQGPLASFRVMEAADGSVYLHSAIHHMLVDEYSSYMVFDALESLLNGSDIGMAFEGAGAHYHKLSHKPDAMLEEWSVRLRGITPFPFRATKKRGEEASRLSRDIFLSQPEQQNSAKSSQINLRDPSALLTMFQISLHRTFSAPEVTLCVPVSLRTGDESWHTVLGDLTSIALIRSQTFPQDTWSAFNSRSSEAFSFATKHVMPVTLIYSHLNLDLNDFPVLFVPHQSGTRGGHQTLKDCTFAMDKPKPEDFGLNFHVFISETGLELMLDYDMAVVDADIAQQLLDAFAQLVLEAKSGMVPEIPQASVSAPLSTGSISDESTSVDNTPTSTREISVETTPEPASPTTLSAFLPDTKGSEDVKTFVDTLREVLDVDFLDEKANLRDLGLDSFTSMSLIGRLRKRLPKVQLTLHDITQHPTLEALTAHLFGMKGQAATSQAVDMTIVEKGRESFTPPTTSTPGSWDTAPASTIQRRFFLLQEKFGDASYSLPTAFQVQGYNIERVLRALETVVNRNGIYRTYFVCTDVGVIQRIDKRFSLKFKHRNLRHLSGPVGWETMVTECSRDANEPFDLEQAPLMRCSGYTLADGYQYLYINMHHIISDKGSLAILLEETVQQYDKDSRGTPRASQTNYESINHDYWSYAKAQERETLQPSLREHWMSVLSSWRGIEKRRLLPPHISDQTPRSVTVRSSLTLENTTLQWIKSIGATPFSGLLAAFMIAVSFDFDQQRPGVLIPVSNRPVDGGRPIHGCFINTMPVCCNFDPSALLLSNLRKVVYSANDVLSHCQVPFEDILDWCDLNLDDFELMFIYHENSTGGLSSIFKPEPSILGHDKNVTPKFPLTFSVTRSSSGTDENTTLDIDLSFDTSRMTEKCARGLMATFETVLRDIGALKTLNETSLAGLLSQSNVKDDLDRFHGPIDDSVNSLSYVHNQVIQTCGAERDRTAIVFESTKSISYSQLADRINATVSWLQDNGVDSTSKDGKICIYSDACIDRIVCILAVMQLGHAYVPLDVRSPVARNLQIIQDCAPLAVLSPQSSIRDDNKFRELTKAVQSGTSATSPPFLVLPDSLDCQRPQKNAVRTVVSSDPAYVLYTSGSTGTPKGVVVNHAATRNSVHQHRKIYRLKRDSRLLQIAPYTFDVSVVDIFATLSTGATLAIGRQDYVLSNLQQVVHDDKITHIATTPTVASLLDPDLSSSIEVLALGGEPMTKPVRDAWADKIHLLNVYGPTETTVNITSCKLELDTPISNIGRPLPNVRVYILDDNNQRVSAGSIGQLAVGGVQVATGYLRAPRGKQAFIAHEDLGRLYLTGDLAKFSEDGSIHLLGRSDSQIKLRGQRIEANEIEAVLYQDFSINKSNVFLLKSPQFDALVCVYHPNISSSPASVGTKETLQLADSRQDHDSDIIAMADDVLSKLPPYFMPTYWLPVTCLPYNRNGKLDRKAISQWAHSLPLDVLEESNIANIRKRNGAGTSPSTSPPTDIEDSTEKWTDKERIVATVFTKILNAHSVTRSSDFFSLKGDSISAVRTCTAIRKAGYDVRVADIYRFPTVSELAGTIKPRESTPVTVSHVPQGEVIEHTPVVEWFLSSQKHNPHWFNQGHAIQLKGSHSLVDLVKAWKRLVEVHPSLRIRGSGLDKGTKAILSTAQISAADILTVSSHVARISEVTPLAEKMQSRLNIAEGPVTAIGEFRVSSGETVHVIVVHHLAIDVVSWRIIFDELDILLQGQDIPPEPATFQTWAARQTKKQAGNTRKVTDVDSDVTPVNQHLFGAYSPELAAQNTISSCQFVNIKAETKDAINLVDMFDDTVAMVDILLAGLLQAFVWWKGTVAPVELCFESHGRDLTDEETDWSRTVGWFTYIIPILFPLAAHLTSIDLVRLVSSTRRAKMDTADMSQSFPPSISKATSMISFNYLGTSSGGDSYTCFERAKVDPGSYEDPKNRRLSLLDFECSISGDVVDLGVIFSKAVHTEEALTELLYLWRQALCNLGEGGLLLASTPPQTIISMPSSVTSPALSPMTPMGNKSLPDMPESVIQSLHTHNIHPDSVVDVTPATDMQAAMFLTSMQSDIYMSYSDFDVEAQQGFSAYRMAESWRRVLSSHAIFRTVFIPDSVGTRSSSNGVLQVVLDPSHRGHALPIFHERPSQEVKVDWGIVLWRLSVWSENGVYRVQWACHHALIDGWSTSQLFRQVRQSYAQGAVQVPALQFNDVSRHLTDTSVQREAVDFWRDYLNQAAPTDIVCHMVSTTTPTTPENGSSASVSEAQRLDVSWEDLQKTATTYRTPIAVLFRSAWALVLARYVCRDDVVFGCVVSGRSLDMTGIDEVIGPVLNVIPTRFQIDWDASLDNYLEAAADAARDVMEHESLSLRRIYQAAKTKALFNTTLQVQNYLQHSSDSEANSPYTLHRTTLSEPNDMAFRVFVEPTTDGKIRVELSSNLPNVTNSYLSNIIDGFYEVVKGFSTSRDRSSTLLKELDILGPRQTSLIDSYTYGGDLQHDGNLNIWQAFANQVKKTPESTAVECWTVDGVAQSASYQQLYDAAESVAGRLYRAGVTRKSIVAVYLDRSVDMVVCLMAISRLDCSYLPIDLAATKDRIAMLIDESKTKTVICAESDRHLFTNVTNILLVEQLCKDDDALNIDLDPVSATKDDLAAILFTSGSTGKPKAVCMPHRQVVGYAMTMIGDNAYNYTSADRIFNFARLVFDVSMTDIFGALFCGATVCVAKQADTVNSLQTLLQIAKITCLNVTPAVASLLDPEDFPDLKNLVTTGELAKKSIITKWAGKVRMVNCAGPTEAVVVVCGVCNVNSDPRCLGPAVRGMHVYILDEHMRKVPLGSQGTMWCAGKQLSLGYLGRPELTEKMYRPNPFGGGLMYNTGDLAVYDDRGNIIYHGRRDDQVKIHGQRVELGEIDRQLSSKDIQVATLYFKELRPARLVAFVGAGVKMSKNSPSDTDLRLLDDATSKDMISKAQEQARRVLPQYMIPHAFFAVPLLPLNPNGKVMRQALKDFYTRHLSLSSEGESEAGYDTFDCRSHTEEEIASILQDMGIKGVSRNKPLIPDVLDSLESLRFAASLQRAFSVSNVNMAFVHRHNSFDLLSHAIDGAITANKENGNNENTMTDEGLKCIVPLSSASKQPRLKMICLFGVTGTPLGYRNLCPHLPSLDLIGIQKMNFGSPASTDTIPEIARKHLPLVLEAQSQGPYLICGFSWAGHTATEIARMIRGQGHEVYLIIIDSHATSRPPLPEDRIITDDHCERFFDAPSKAACKSAEQLQYRQNLINEIRHNLVAMNNYLVDGKYNGPTLFIKAGAETDTVSDNTNGYSSIMSDLELSIADGAHYTLLKAQQSVVDISSAITKFVSKRVPGA